MKALVDANRGHSLGYGDDDWTARAIAQFRRVFGDDTQVFFVATGTAANTLAVASLTRQWQRVLCYDQSHWNDDESTAPERLTQCRTATIEPREPKRNSRIAPDQLARPGATTRGVHQPQPGVVTISNPTEFGEVYAPEDVRALADAAHDLGFALHVDGARFANAVATVMDRHGLPETEAARSLTIDAGVDAISFGGTKNGLALGEAVLFFPQGDGSRCEEATRTFPYHRKSTGHLLSKHRFVSAPLAATLEEGAWVRHAAHANRMATLLDDGLGSLGVHVAYSVDANAVFPVLESALDSSLRARGHSYYAFGPVGWNIARFMCSFDTSEDEVRALLNDVAGLTTDATTG
jgi:threonine aldolase